MNPKDKIHPSWKPILSLLNQEPLLTLSQETLPNISFQPKPEDVFNAFQMPLSEVKVVILGQDPYPKPGDAIGYAFATAPNRNVPKSLQVLQKELKLNFPEEDWIFNNPKWKTLDHWIESGVLLLNTALTVETGNAGSHLKEWERFTQMVIHYLSDMNPCIWLFWGAKAKAFIPFINKNPFHVKGYTEETIELIPSNPDWNYILTSGHPARELYPNGLGSFYGCNHFKYSNIILKKLQKPVITW